MRTYAYIALLVGNTAVRAAAEAWLTTWLVLRRCDHPRLDFFCCCCCCVIIHDSAYGCCCCSVIHHGPRRLCCGDSRICSCFAVAVMLLLCCRCSAAALKLLFCCRLLLLCWCLVDALLLLCGRFAVDLLLRRSRFAVVNGWRFAVVFFAAVRW